MLFYMGWFIFEPEIIPAEPDLGNASEGREMIHGQFAFPLRVEKPSPLSGDGFFYWIPDEATANGSAAF
jgi:hypothetical protein